MTQVYGYKVNKLINELIELEGERKYLNTLKQNKKRDEEIIFIKYCINDIKEKLRRMKGGFGLTKETMINSSKSMALRNSLSTSSFNSINEAINDYHNTQKWR